MPHSFRIQARLLRFLALTTVVAGTLQCGGTPKAVGVTDSIVVPDSGPELDSGTDSEFTPDAVCPADPSDFEIPEGCNPLAGEWDCLLPYPSDFFLIDDPSKPSGKRLAVTGAARLERPDGRFVEPYLVHPADGFSHHPPVLALFPGGVDPDNLVFHTGDVSASLGPDSTTVLLEADTGDRILHFAELDPRAETDAERALLIRPLVRLRNSTRYIVAIRRLKDHAGLLIEAPDGFRRIRDGEAVCDPVLGPIAQRYVSEVFTELLAAGVDRTGLQLGWDFSTQTEANVTGDMLAIRADLMARLEAEPPVVTITSVEDDVDDEVLREVEGTVRVPLYLESSLPAARLNRDAGGNVVANGEVEVPFILRIPKSMESFDGQTPARVLQYAHGFFADRHEIDVGWLNEFADKFGFVLASMDWWGMSLPDVDPILEAIISEPSEMLLFTDRLHQAMINQIALSYAVAGPLTEAPDVQIGGVTVYDPEQIYFYGVSQGGVIGGTYAALAPLVDRAVLGVGGASFTFLMFRSRYFGTFLTLLESFLESPLESQKWVALLATTFDRIDAITYAPHAIADLYPGSPSERRILMQNAIGDTDVTNLATHLEARALGVELLQPSSREIPFLDTVDAPTDGSALVEFDFGIAEPLPGTYATLPASANPGHEGVRRLDAGMEQIDSFLRPDGVIEHTCEGLCDPE